MSTLPPAVFAPGPGLLDLCRRLKQRAPRGRTSPGHEDHCHLTRRGINHVDKGVVS